MKRISSWYFITSISISRFFTVIFSINEIKTHSLYAFSINLNKGLIYLLKRRSLWNNRHSAQCLSHFISHRPQMHQHAFYCIMAKSMSQLNLSCNRDSILRSFFTKLKLQMKCSAAFRGGLISAGRLLTPL